MAEGQTPVMKIVVEAQDKASVVFRSISNNMKKLVKNTEKIAISDAPTKAIKQMGEQLNSSNKPVEKTLSQLHKMSNSFDELNKLKTVGVGINKLGKPFDLLTGKLLSMDDVIKRLNKHFPRFKMGMLSVMFAGMALSRAMSGLLRPAAQAAGIFTIIGTTLKLLFLPIMLVLLPYLLKIMREFNGLSKNKKKIIGFLVLFLFLLGKITTIIGQFSLAAMGLPSLFASTSSAVGRISYFFSSLLVDLEAFAIGIGVPIELIIAIIAAFIVGFVVMLKEWANTFRQIFEGAFNVIKGILDFFIGLFTGNFKLMKKGISETMKGLLEFIKGVVRAIFLAIMSVFVGFAKIIDMILNFFGINSDLAGIFKGFTDWLLGLIDDAFSWISNFINNWGDALSNAFSGIWNRITRIIRGAIRLIMNIIQPIIDIFNRVINLANNVGGIVGGALGGLKGILGGIPSGLKNLLGLAEGGIVTRPTIAQIGENGPEAVIPLKDYKNKGGVGGSTVNNFSPNINISANVNSEIDIRTLADKLSSILYEDLRRSFE